MQRTQRIKENKSSFEVPLRDSFAGILCALCALWALCGSIFVFRDFSKADVWLI